MSDGLQRSRSPSPARIDTTSDGYYNPGLTLDDGDVAVDVGGGHGGTYSSGKTTTNSAATAAAAGVPQQKWEQFDDEGDAGIAVSATQSSYKPRAGDTGEVPSQNGRHPEPRLAPPPKVTNGNAAKTSPAPDQSPAAQQQAVTSHPVHYDRGRDQAVVQNGTAAGTAEGGAVIITRSYPEHWRDLPERPLTARHMKLLKIFGMVSVFLFFPSGIPAMYFAFRTQREFDEGIMRGNIDRAQKYRRRAEHLIILSAVLAVLTAVLVFALVERAQRGDSYISHSYIAHGSTQGR